MVGNAATSAIRVGEWSWAASLLEEWLENEITGGFYLELYVDRAILGALTGADPEADLAAAEALLPAMEGDPQYTSYLHWGRAWAAFVAGDLAAARRDAAAAADATNFFVPISLPLAGRAALWADDATGAGEVLARLDASVIKGQAIGLDRATLRAGLAALEGRRGESLAGYREALRGWRQIGCVFDEAMAVLDMAILLAPTESEMAEASTAIESARETLTRIGAAPFLARLNAAQSRAATRGPAATTEAVTAMAPATVNTSAEALVD
jgi:hypothetical protein